MSLFDYCRSVILFGNLFQIFKLVESEKRLNNITKEDNYNDFLAKSAFNDYQRSEEAIRYGFTLTLEQRKTLNKLFMVLSHGHHAHNLFTGRYIRSNGNIKAYFFVEALLFVLSFIAITCALVILANVVTAVLFSSITMVSKLSILGILAAINGVPLFHFYYRFLSPSHSYLCNRNKINNQSTLA